MGGTQDKRQQPGQPGKGPDEMGTPRKRPTGQDPVRPQQPEKPSPSQGQDESKRRREEDPPREEDAMGNEL